MMMIMRTMKTIVMMVKDLDDDSCSCDRVLLVRNILIETMVPW